MDIQIKMQKVSAAKFNKWLDTYILEPEDGEKWLTYCANQSLEFFFEHGGFLFEFDADETKDGITLEYWVDKKEIENFNKISAAFN